MRARFYAFALAFVVCVGLGIVPLVQCKSWNTQEAETDSVNDFIQTENLMQAEINSTLQDSQTQICLPWVIRHMETDWELVGSNGSANLMPNSTLSETAGVEYVEPCELQATDFNHSVENGGIHVLRQLEPEEIVVQSAGSGYDAPATPLTPAKEGHWFPKQTYSRLYFDFVADSWWGVSFRIHLEIEQDQDTSSRYLRIKLDGNTFHEVIISGSGFHDDIWTPIIWWGSEHKITLEIYYGGNVEKGWKLKFFWVYNSNGTPLDVTGEYTHKAYHCNLIYQVKLGANSKLHIKTENAGDSTPRYCYVYIDGALKLNGISPGQYEVSLGNYQDDTVHELRVDIWASHLVECGKKITILIAHHSGGFIDVDYMSGHEPSDSELSYLESYYITHGYHRIELNKDDSVPYVEWFLVGGLAGDSGGFWEYYNAYSDHKSNPQWEWMIWVHKVKDEYGAVDWLGAHITGGEPDGCCGIVIHDWLLWWGAYNHYFVSWSAARKSCSMHEVGHHYNIIDVDGQGNEVYCPNTQCCMAVASMVWAMEEPWYCEHHWSQRFFPGW